MARDLSRIRTVVIVTLENRSFDHILGYLGLPDSGHPMANRIEGIQHAQSYYAHSTYPPRAITSPSITPDPPHERRDIDVQLNSLAGPMRGFVDSYRNSFPGADVARVMEYCTKGYLPTTEFLARNFTICDNWFAPLPASTLPNRLMAMSGYALVDYTPSGYFQIFDNLFYDEPDDLVYDWLSSRSIRWRVYLGGYSFFFMQMPRVLRLYEADVEEHELFRPLDQMADDFRNGDLPDVVFVEPLYQDDYRRGTAQASDDHPPASLYGGQRFLKVVYEALSAGEAWNNLAAFITYDEHGSFFDHVRPPALPTASPPGARYTDGFKTLGVRVPAIVVSPYARTGGLCEEILDHTSILKFLGDKYNGGRYSNLVDRRGVPSASVVLDDQLLTTGQIGSAPTMD